MSCELLLVSCIMYFFIGGKFEWSLWVIVGHGGIVTKFS